MGDQSLREFAEWLIRMDEPGSVARQTVTLTRIIERAKDALTAALPIPQVEEEGESSAALLGLVTEGQQGLGPARPALSDSPTEWRALDLDAHHPDGGAR